MIILNIIIFNDRVGKRYFGKYHCISSPFFIPISGYLIHTPVFMTGERIRPPKLNVRQFFFAHYSIRIRLNNFIYIMMYLYTISNH